MNISVRIEGAPVDNRNRNISNMELDFCKL